MAGCADDGTAGDVEHVVHPPAPGPSTIEVFTPQFEVAPYDEVFMCMKVPLELTEDTYVSKSVAYQAEGGHHSMLFYIVGEEPPNPLPHECTEQDMGMGGLRFLGVGTARGSGIELPEGRAFKIPAGASLYVQSHYLNLTGERLRAEDALQLTTIPASDVADLAGAFTELDLTFELPARGTVSRTVDCTIPQDMYVPWMIPHMHEWGTHYLIERVDPEGETTTLWEADWDVALRDDFPIIDFPEHLALSPEDRIRTTCTWSNDTDEPMIFPTEMCATFMVFYPSADGALLACDETGEHFRP